MKKWIMYAVIFVAGFIGVSLWSFLLIIHPSKILLDRTPEDVNLPAEDVTITASDGTELSAWYIQSPSAKQKAVILLHGYPAEKSDMLLIAKDLYPDFSLLLLDLRYFGDSEGKYTTLGIKEHVDVIEALDFLNDKEYERIGVVGFSFGGTVGLITTAKDKRIQAVASYAAYADIRLLGWETYRHLWVLKYPLVELMIFWSKLLFGTPVTEVSPLRIVNEITVPTLIFHSREDEQIAFSHAELLKNALKHDTAEYYFHDGFHGELPFDFQERLLEFFKRSL